MREAVKHQALITTIAVLVLFTHLGTTRLWDQDEAYFGGTAAEMYARGEWVVPYFNGEMFGHKPPLMYWSMIVGFHWFGVRELGARFGAAVFGVLTALLTYHLGRRLFSPGVGLWAGLAMATCLMFAVVARAATPDSFLVFFSALALYVFLIAVTPGKGSQTRIVQEITPVFSTPSPCPLPEGARGVKKVISWTILGESCDHRPIVHSPPRPLAPSPPLFPTPPYQLSFPAAALMYSIMGIAVLVKGPIGVLLPMAVIGLFLLVMTPQPWQTEGVTLAGRARLVWRSLGPRNFLKTVWRMRPLTAIAAVLLVAGPWFIAVGVRTDGAFLKEFFGVHNFGRFFEPMDSHRGSLFYYVPAVLVGFFPWSIFAVPTLLYAVRQIRNHDPQRIGLIFVACWAAVYLGFFSLASTKLPSYVLPAYPALALLSAGFIDFWIHRPAVVGRLWPRVALGIFAAVGLTLIVAMPALGSLTFQGRPMLEKLDVSAALGRDFALLGMVGVAPLAGGLIGLVFAERRRPRAVAITMVASSAAFVVSLLAGAAVRIDRYQNSQAIASFIHEAAAEHPAQIAQYRYFRPSLTYYTQSRVERCGSPEEAAIFLQSSADAFLITTEQQLADLKPHLPPHVAVLDRRPLFPKRGTLVVLGHNSRIARHPAEQKRGL